GKVVVLEFMATWCITCAQQEPILKELYSKYQSDNVILLSVTIDPAFDTPDVLRSHIAKKGIPWMVARDTTLMLTDYFQVMELSTILIIAPDGEVKNVFKGLTDLDTLSSAVDALL
ncbi:MAG: TlpA family protein disulfide reductase, partial [Nitrososphaerales archaeon]